MHKDLLVIIDAKYIWPSKKSSNFDLTYAEHLECPAKTNKMIGAQNQIKQQIYKI